MPFHGGDADREHKKDVAPYGKHEQRERKALAPRLCIFLCGEEAEVRQSCRVNKDMFATHEFEECARQGTSKQTPTPGPDSSTRTSRSALVDLQVPVNVLPCVG
jgi:hypothetical protein